MERPLILQPRCAVERPSAVGQSAPAHVDPLRDVDELIHEVGQTKPQGARVTHRRCGASFQVRLED
jgi:hypothetical protein